MMMMMRSEENPPPGHNALLVYTSCRGLLCLVTQLDLIRPWITQSWTTGGKSRAGGCGCVEGVGLGCGRGGEGV